VLVRVLDAVIVLITVAFALMTFEAVRQFGITLFASAGVAGIIAGLAARPVLTNFIAGVQIAVAQPIRIDDAVIVENESGNVEEITFSYVVVRLWDLRRMVVPPHCCSYSSALDRKATAVSQYPPAFAF
jgi:small-conductance mechanosensitive channel